MDVFCSSTSLRRNQSSVFRISLLMAPANDPHLLGYKQSMSGYKNRHAYSSRWIQTTLGYTLFWLSTLISIIDIDCGNEANEVLSSPSSLTQLWRIKAELVKNVSCSGSLCSILPALCISPLVVAAVLGLWVSQHGAGAIAVITMKLDEI